MPQQRKIILLAFLLALLASTGRSFAASVTVCSSGCTFTTLRAAVAGLPSSGTTIVMMGNTTEVGPPVAPPTWPWTFQIVNGAAAAVTINYPSGFSISTDNMGTTVTGSLTAPIVFNHTSTNSAALFTNVNNALSSFTFCKFVSGYTDFVFTGADGPYLFNDCEFVGNVNSTGGVTMTNYAAYARMINCVIRDVGNGFGYVEGNGHVAGNLFYNVDFVNNKYGAYFLTGNSGAGVTNCVFLDTAGVSEIASNNLNGGTVRADYCVFGAKPVTTTYLSLGSFNSLSSPASEFVNPAFGSEDLHLIAGAQSNGQGTNLSASFTVDHDGAARPASGNWDIGVYVSGLVANTSTATPTATGTPTSTATPTITSTPTVTFTPSPTVPVLTKSVNISAAANNGDAVTYTINYQNDLTVGGADDFESDAIGTLPAGWTFATGYGDTGVYQVQNIGTGGGRGISMVSTANYPKLVYTTIGNVADGSIEADVKVTAGTQIALMWNAGGMGGVGNFPCYQAVFQTSGGVMFGVDNPGWSNPFTGSGQLTSGIWYRIKFSVFGTAASKTLTAYVNGTQVANYTTATVISANSTYNLGQSYAAIQVNGGGTAAYWDNVTVTSASTMYSAHVVDTLPNGFTYDSATGSPTVAGSLADWNLGDLTFNSGGALTLIGHVSDCGFNLVNSAALNSNYTNRLTASNAVTTTLENCTPTPTHTGTDTATPTATSTPTDSATPTVTRTPSDTPTASGTSTPTASPTQTATNTLATTATSTATHTATKSATSTGTDTSTPTATRTATMTPTQTPSRTSTSSATDTATASATSTPTLTPSSTAADTATGTPTDTGTATSTRTGTSTSTDTATETATFTASSTATDSATDTATRTATDSPTSTFTMTPTSTLTDTPTRTATRTPTSTKTPTDTRTSTPTATATWTPTSTATETQTPTPSSTATLTPSVTPTPTLTPSAMEVAYPNPSDGIHPVRFWYQLDFPATEVKAALFTTAFRKIYEEDGLPAFPGRHQYTLDYGKVPSRLANGFYYLVLEVRTNGNRSNRTMKLLVIH